MSHYARRKDANQNDITAMAGACGFIVLDCSRFGDNFPDVIVAFEVSPSVWRVDMWEIKTAKNKLREGQKRFFATWPGPKCVIRSDDDVRARREYWLKEAK